MSSVNVIYYKSDFPVLWPSRTCCEGKPLPTDADFEIKFSTGSPMCAYTAARRRGMHQNCREENGELWFIFNNHGLQPGMLNYEVHYYLPDERFPDGVRDVFHRGTLNVQLTKENVGCPDKVEVEVMAPYIKGEDGKSLTYEDLTEEEKRDLVSHFDPEMLGVSSEEFSEEDIERIAQAVIDAESGAGTGENQDKPDTPGDVTGAEG